MSLPQIDVLVIARDATFVAPLVRALHERALTTDVAGDLVEAKRLLSRGAYGATLLDLTVDGTSGMAMITFVQTERRAAGTIIVITSANAPMLERLDRSVVKTVLFKPLDAAQIATHISEAVRHSHPRDSR